MSQNERMDTLAIIEELTNRVGALAAATGLIAKEQEQLQAKYYNQTAEVGDND